MAFDAVITNELMAGAELLLAAKRALVDGLPAGFVSDPAVFLTFELYLARGRDIAITDAELARRIGIDRPVVMRWLRAMESKDMVIRVAPDRHALTETGAAIATTTLIAMGKAQHALRTSANGAGAATVSQ